MTRDEILQAYEESLKQAGEQHEKALKKAREWCLGKLKEVRKS